MGMYLRQIKGFQGRFDCRYVDLLVKYLDQGINSESADVSVERDKRNPDRTRTKVLVLLSARALKSSHNHNIKHRKR